MPIFNNIQDPPPAPMIGAQPPNYFQWMAKKGVKELGNTLLSPWRGEPTASAPMSTGPSAEPQTAQPLGAQWNPGAMEGKPSPQMLSAMAPQQPIATASTAPSTPSNVAPFPGGGNGGVGLYGVPTPGPIDPNVSPSRFAGGGMPTPHFPSVGGINPNPWVSAILAQNQERSGMQRASAVSELNAQNLHNQMAQEQLTYNPGHEWMSTQQGLSGLRGQQLQQMMEMMQLGAFSHHQAMESLQTLGQLPPQMYTSFSKGPGGQMTPGTAPWFDQLLKQTTGGLGVGGEGGQTNAATPVSPQPQQQPSEKAGFMRSALHSLAPTAAASGAFPIAAQMTRGIPYVGAIAPWLISALAGWGAGKAGDVVDPGYKNMQGDIYGQGAGAIAGLIGGNKLGKASLPKPAQTSQPKTPQMQGASTPSAPPVPTNPANPSTGPSRTGPNPVVTPTTPTVPPAGVPGAPTPTGVPVQWVPNPANPKEPLQAEWQVGKTVTPNVQPPPVQSAPIAPRGPTLPSTPKDTSYVGSKGVPVSPDITSYENYLKTLQLPRGTPPTVSDLRKLNLTSQEMHEVMKGYRYFKGLREGGNGGGLTQ